MTVLAAQQINAPLGGIDNAHLSGDIVLFEAALWPPHLGEIITASLPALTTHFPVEANARTISTQAARSYTDDFYYRVHVTPQSLDLGNVVSTQINNVYVWNAYFVARTLTTLSGTDEGISIGGQPAPPLLIQPLTELLYQVSVTPEGQPVLDTTIVWTFDNGDAPGLRITANRISAWTFVPDWGDGVKEQLQWLTEIFQSETLAEQRRSMRIAPRRVFSAPMYVEGRERQLLDLALFGWGARNWALPIWPDIQLLNTSLALGAVRINCSTQYLDFVVDGLAMLRGETAFDYEAVEILAIDVNGIDLKRATQQAWPIGTRLYPVRTAQLVKEPELMRMTDTTQSADVQFLIMEPCDWPEVMPATLYRSWPVLEMRPDESDDITNQYARLLSTLDSGSALPLLSDIAGRAMPMRSWRWQELGRAARASLRSLLYALRGQQAAIWIPTHADDLTLVAVISPSATTIDIAYIGYTRFGQNKSGRRDFRIELMNGAAFHRRIIGSTEISSTVERLSIDATLGVTINPSDILRISWMTLSRGNSDQIDIDHVTDSEGLADCMVNFRAVRDDEF